MLSLGKEIELEFDVAIVTISHIKEDVKNDAFDEISRSSDRLIYRLQELKKIISRSKLNNDIKEASLILIEMEGYFDPYKRRPINKENKQKFLAKLEYYEDQLKGLKVRFINIP